MSNNDTKPKVRRLWLTPVQRVLKHTNRDNHGIAVRGVKALTVTVASAVEVSTRTYAHIFIDVKASCPPFSDGFGGDDVHQIITRHLHFRIPLIEPGTVQNLLGYPISPSSQTTSPLAATLSGLTSTSCCLIAEGLLEVSTIGRPSPPWSSTPPS